MANDAFAFALFAVIFCGGLAALTIGMVWIVTALIRRNRRDR